MVVDGERERERQKAISDKGGDHKNASLPDCFTE